MRDHCLELARRIGRDPDEVVEWWAERAAIREVEGGQARDDAEREAFEELRAMFEGDAHGVAGLPGSERKGPRAAGATTVAAGAKRADEAS